MRPMAQALKIFSLKRCQRTGSAEGDWRKNTLSVAGTCNNIPSPYCQIGGNGDNTEAVLAKKTALTTYDVANIVSNLSAYQIKKRCCGGMCGWGNPAE